MSTTTFGEDDIGLIVSPSSRRGRPGVRQATYRRRLLFVARDSQRLSRIEFYGRGDEP